MSTRRILGPFNRVEGDLEVQVEIEHDRISKAWVNSPLFRGFEKILQHKAPLDALVYTPRICGICSVSQSVAAAQYFFALSRPIIFSHTRGNVCMVMLYRRKF